MGVTIMSTFKKLVVLLLSAGMILAFIACGSDSDNSSEEPAPAEEQEETNTSTDSDISDPFNFETVGFSYELPEDVKIENGTIEKQDFGEISFGSGVMMGYPVYYDMTEEELMSLSDDEASSLNTAGTFVIICVKDAKDTEEAKDRFLKAMADFMGHELSQEEIEIFSAVKEIHNENGYIWFMSTREKSEVNEKCQAEYDALHAATEDIVANHMKFFAPQEWEGFAEDTVLSFETEDIDGNPVKSEELFAKNKVTMINLWGTYCGPCIVEMPELEKLSQDFASKGGGVVGVVVDVPVGNDKFLENAHTIVKETGVTYPNLRAWDGYDKILEHQGTPTTYFVDSNGKLIGTPILGGQIDVYPKQMEALLAEAE